MALSPERRREIEEEEKVRLAIRRKEGSSGRAVAYLGALVLIIGVVLVMYYLSLPHATSDSAPDWPFMVCVAGFLLFIAGRLASRPRR